MPDIPRVLITGSRDWDDEQVIEKALQRLGDRLGQFTLVHGTARGVDSMAAAAHRRLRLGPVEGHPAQWQEHGKRAGYVRNAYMVSLGASACLAFIKNDSRGANMCADLAEKAGIPTYRVRRP